MKILLRKLGDKYYVWKDARWEDYAYYITVDGYECEISQKEIIAVEDDTRDGYVACANCGKLIKNDPESIEAHFAEEEAKKDCFKCGYLRVRDKTNLGSDYKRNENGEFVVTESFTASLQCSVGYWYKDIDSEDAKNECIYKKCRKCGVVPIDDIFVKYPGVFEKFLTVDTLIAKKCESEGLRGGHFEYDLKCRNTLKACVNEMGVVDHFRLYYRNHSCSLYYSDKYNRLFTASCGQYSEEAPYGVPDAKMEQIRDKIVALYKEANK